MRNARERAETAPGTARGRGHAVDRERRTRALVEPAALVMDPSGAEVGRVSRLAGDFVGVRTPPGHDRRHGWLPLTWIQEVSSAGVVIDRSVDEVHIEWADLNIRA